MVAELSAQELQELAFSASLDIPAPSRLRNLRLPASKKSMRVQKLDEKVRSMLMEIIQGRLAEKDTKDSATICSG